MLFISPFGHLNYHDRNKEWFGMVENINPNDKVELSIEVENELKNIDTQTELIRNFAKDYNTIILQLYQLVYNSFIGSKYEKTFSEIKEMYFLAAVSLKSDCKTWLLTLEPNYNVTSIYNHFKHFTMLGRDIIWKSF